MPTETEAEAELKTKRPAAVFVSLLHQTGGGERIWPLSGSPSHPAPSGAARSSSTRWSRVAQGPHPRAGCFARDREMPKLRFKFKLIHLLGLKKHRPSVAPVSFPRKRIGFAAFLLSAGRNQLGFLLQAYFSKCYVPMNVADIGAFGHLLGAEPQKLGSGSIRSSPTCNDPGSKRMNPSVGSV